MCHDPQRPLVYPCQGNSNLAQLARALVRRLLREGHAEVFDCAGDCPRPVLVLDGCRRRCASARLARQGLPSRLQLTLSAYGLKRCHGHGCSPEESEQMYEEVLYLLRTVVRPRP